MDIVLLEQNSSLICRTHNQKTSMSFQNTMVGQDRPGMDSSSPKGEKEEGEKAVYRSQASLKPNAQV